MADIEIDVTQNSNVVSVGGLSSLTAGTGLLANGTPGGTLVGSGTIAADLAPNGGGTANQLVRATDSRLSDARTPALHASSHASGGSDPVTLAQTQVVNLVSDLAAKVPTTRLVTAGTALTGGGALSTDVTLNVDLAPSGGGSATQAVSATDTRLSNARTPTIHGGTHGSAGTDPIPAGGLAQSQVANLTTDLAQRVPLTRQVIAGTGLTGGGDLTANVTLSCDFAASGSATVGKPVEATDSRLNNARTPTGAASGDLAGTYPGPTVDGLAGVQINTAAPATGDVWQYNGGQWDHVASTLLATSAAVATYIPTPGSVTRTVASRLNDIISVKNFGAIGDGVTDDTAAIQAALTAGAGKSVFVPDGTYVLNAQLLVSANTCFYGKPGSAILKVLPTASPTTFNNGLLLQGSNITIEGLTIEGTNEYSFVGGARTAYASGILTNPSLGPFTNINILNCGINKWGWGIFINRVSYFRVIGNRCWGGEQTSTTVPVPDQTTFDISAYTTASITIGGIIANNFALGNVDTGIGTSAVIGEQGIVITGNVVTPRQADGVTPVATANLRTRYGIHTGYAGTLPVRASVSNNYVQDYDINGIYVHGNTMPTGDVTISGNVVYRCGGNTSDPSYSSLKGGIWVKGGADSISGNVVVDCYRVGIEVSTPQVTPPPGVQRSRSVVANNNIARIVNDPVPGSDSGFGILLTGYDNSRILISGNRIQNTAHRAIDSIVITDNADNGGIHIIGNLIEVTHAKGAIFLNQGGALVSHSSVVGNHVVGNDNTTSNGGLNAGIWINGKIHCMSNTIRNFHRGIETTFNTRVLDVQCNGNAIYNCHYGITGQGNGPWIVSDNVFSGITNRELHAGAYQGAIVRATGSGQPTVVHIVRTAAPTTDTWAVGDYCKNATPSIGQPKGWYCTVAGTPGTWVSEGNL